MSNKSRSVTADNEIESDLISQLTEAFNQVSSASDSVFRAESILQETEAPITKRLKDVSTLIQTVGSHLEDAERVLENWLIFNSAKDEE